MTCVQDADATATVCTGTGEIGTHMLNSLPFIRIRLGCGPMWTDGKASRMSEVVAVRSSDVRLRDETESGYRGPKGIGVYVLGQLEPATKKDSGTTLQLSGTPYLIQRCL